MHQGVVVAIDSWNVCDATQGLNIESTEYSSWNKINFNILYVKTKKLIQSNKLNNYCTLVRSTAQEALNLFSDESIDFLHFDGSFQENCAYADLVAYLPKLKNGGYVLLSNSNRLSSGKALVFLLERTNLISAFTEQKEYVLFQRDKEREKNSEKLFKDYYVH